MINRSAARAIVTLAVLTGGALLAGCNTDDASLASNAKANQPVPPKVVAAMTAKDMELQSPILIRLFKQEAELEVWKQDRSGKFALLKTYPICRWSGDLGPKTREGDRQAPEGFYSISPAQMNPRSAYYLSFNTGYPNAYDKSLGHTGSELMVHGDCSSRGCYAMTDEQIAEIYAIGRESFFGGQRAFQFQAYPFRMTPANFAKHRNNPNMPFWKMIKEGNDHFEATHQEPKVAFCEHKYVFDPAPPPGSARPLEFNASAKCPAYAVPDDIASAVREKQQRDNTEIANLISKGSPVAKLNTGIDGGMNRGVRRQAAGGSDRAFRPRGTRPEGHSVFARAWHHSTDGQPATQFGSSNSRDLLRTGGRRDKAVVIFPRPFQAEQHLHQSCPQDGFRRRRHDRHNQRLCFGFGQTQRVRSGQAEDGNPGAQRSASPGRGEAHSAQNGREDG